MPRLPRKKGAARVRQTKVSVRGNSRRTSGITRSSNIGRSSRGGPGSRMSQPGRPPARKGLGRTGMARPGAVPKGLARTVAPAGTMACTSFLAGNGRLRTAKKRWISAQTVSSKCRVRPSNWAMSSRVMSSDVGPSPPVTMTRSARPRASRTACWMSAPVSGTATWRATLWPRSASRRQSHC